MAVTNENSTQLEAQLGKTKLDAVDFYSKLRVLAVDFTQGADAGDANSTVGLCKLPPGKVKVYTALSRLYNSAFGSSRTLDVGYDAYVEPDGTSKDADEDGIHSAAAVASAGAITLGDEVGGDGTITFNSRGGVTLRAKVEGGTLPAAATLNGYIVISVE